MQITRQTEYAIKTMLELAKVQGNELLPTRVISVRQDIPEDFLKKTIKMLSVAGLIHTVRGVQGGVRLAMDPAKITFADIIAAIEGPVAIHACLARGSNCPHQQHCVISPILARAQQAFLQELSRESLADLVGKELEI